jgi:hypothetical protein
MPATRVLARPALNENEFMSRVSSYISQLTQVVEIEDLVVINRAVNVHCVAEK